MKENIHITFSVETLIESAGEKWGEVELGGSSGLLEEKLREGRPPWNNATAVEGGATMDRHDGGIRGATMDQRDDSAVTAGAQGGHGPARLQGPGGWGRAAAMDRPVVSCRQWWRSLLQEGEGSGRERLRVRAEI